MNVEILHTVDVCPCTLINPGFVPCIVAKELYTDEGAAVPNVMLYTPVEVNETVAVDTPKLLATVDPPVCPDET